MASGYPVSFRGTFPKDHMAAVLSELDFLVIPSVWYENSPLVLLYALATHTPVIVSDVPGLTQFVQHGKNAFVFKRGSAEDLTTILGKIVEDPELGPRMSANTHYHRSTADMTESVIQLYENVLKRKI
jgi:glycosyltransferase involved in cell wall biosynthesis